MRRVASGMCLLTCMTIMIASCTSSSTGGAPPASTGTTALATGQSSDVSVPAAVPRVTVPVAYTPVLVRVLGEPTFPFLGTDNKYHVAYDLEFTNATTSPATIQKLEVVDGADPSKVLTTYSADSLTASDPRTCVDSACGVLRTLNAFNGKVTSAVIEPSSSLMMYVTFTLDSLETAPKVVLHRLTLLGRPSPVPGDPEPVTELVTPYNIAAGKTMSLGPPVSGKNWVALNGCCAPYYPHVTSANAFDGKLQNAQRFAIDWKELNDQGQFYSGDRTKNESYVDYGKPILAVADGTIEEVFDELDPNDPGVLPARDPVKGKQLTVKNADGNYIVLNIGNGLYTNYAHLQKGSMKVKKGDKVKKGQVIAALGNTGNANASHMHFHVMDGPSPIAANGIPYVIDSFELVGQTNMTAFNAADDYLTPPPGTNFIESSGAPQQRTNQLPLAFTIVNFPG